jgi:hypothetical protein
MTANTPRDPGDDIYEIRTHLLYELQWMIYAAARFQASGDPSVALIDSAAVHARNLFEFASKGDARRFTLHALGGSAKVMESWTRWTNNRVTHMLDREGDKAPWPDGLDNSRPDKLMVMAGAVLNRLEDGGKSIPPGPVSDAFDTVVNAARRYWLNPTEATHAALAALYDDSRDGDADPY